MRLYLFGLLSGLLVAGLVGVVACGPMNGTGDGGNGGDVGISVGALSVKELKLNCTNTTALENRKGIQVEGISFAQVVSVNITNKASDGSLLSSGGVLYQKNGTVYVVCREEWGEFTLRVAVK